MNKELYNEAISIIKDFVNIENHPLRGHSATCSYCQEDVIVGQKENHKTFCPVKKAIIFVEKLKEDSDPKLKKIKKQIQRLMTKYHYTDITHIALKEIIDEN